MTPEYEAAELVNRLRGIVNIPINDGCGPIEGEMVFTRQFPSTPIQHEAADIIELLESNSPVSRLRIDDLIERLEMPGYYMGLPDPYVPPIHTKAAARLRSLIGN